MARTKQSARESTAGKVPLSSGAIKKIDREEMERKDPRNWRPGGKFYTPPTKEMGHEQKLMLSRGINRIFSKHSAEIIEIVKAQFPDFGNTTPFNLDLEKCANCVLWKLHALVCKHK